MNVRRIKIQRIDLIDLIDLQSAFDTIDSEIMLQKLKAINIKWFK